MATTTSRLQLVKPSYTDIADVGVLNANMDKIDAFASLITLESNNLRSPGAVFLTYPDATAPGVFKAHVGASANGIVLSSEPSGDVSDPTAQWAFNHNTGKLRVKLGSGSYKDYPSSPDAAVTTVSTVLTANSDAATVNSLSAVKCCGIMQLNVSWTNKNAISVGASGNATDIVIATLKSGYTPAINCWAMSVVVPTTGIESDKLATIYYSVSSNGNIVLSAADARGEAYTIAAGCNHQLRAMFILA